MNPLPSRVALPICGGVFVFTALVLSGRSIAFGNSSLHPLSMRRFVFVCGSDICMTLVQSLALSMADWLLNTDTFSGLSQTSILIACSSTFTRPILSSSLSKDHPSSGCSPYLTTLPLCRSRRHIRSLTVSVASRRQRQL